MRTALLLALVALPACNQQHRDHVTVPDDPGVPPFAAVGPQDAIPTSCVNGSAPVYVLSEDQTLYLFDPTTLSFALVGPLDCTGGNDVPEAMSIDRYNTAWVHYSDNRIYNVSVIDATCKATHYAPLQLNTAIYDLAFAGDVASSPTETLYASLEGAKGIGRIDTGSLTLTVIGKSTDPLYENQFAVTGTEDARLFGLFHAADAFTIAEIDKYSGRLTVMKELPMANAAYTWAWAFWGGVFWIFTNNGDPTSDVSTYDPRDGTSSTVMRNIGFNVVSAGVSTCAPIM